MIALAPSLVESAFASLTATKELIARMNSHFRQAPDLTPLDKT